MIAPSNPEGIIHKSDKQLLREAGAKILQLEKEAEDGVKTIEQLTWQNSRRQITIMALGIHFQLTPGAMHGIVKPYFDQQLEALKKQVADIKEKFVADLKDGKPVQFTVVENPDAAPDAPKEP